jgi:hypothetical protein
MTKVQNDSGLSLGETNAALKDAVDIAVGPCSIRAAHLRGDGGPPDGLRSACDLMDGRPNRRTIDSLINDLLWRHVVRH